MASPFVYNEPYEPWMDWPKCAGCHEHKRDLNDRDLCDECELRFCRSCGAEAYPYCDVQCQADDLLAKGGAK